MSLLLDPRRTYVLKGEDSRARGHEGADGEIPPRVLHIKLSPAMLEEMVAKERKARLVYTRGSDPLLCVDEKQHALQSAGESNPHEVYSSSLDSSTMHLVGSVSSRLSMRPDSKPSSSAAIRLKERREMEEARKTEHRTVLLDSTPSTSKVRSSNPSTSTLKLRAKGLAPSSINSPLNRSRAGTPNEGYSSHPGSPNNGAAQRGAKTPPATAQAWQQHSTPKFSPLGGTGGSNGSPPTLRRRLVQLLAKGALSRRDIVLQLQGHEQAAVSLLQQVGQAAPTHLQPPADASKKFNGPVNRRASQVAPSSGNGDRGASTFYVLKDDCYSEVLIKEWADYDAKERRVVSELMEAALNRLGWNRNTEEWKRLYPDGRPTAADALRKAALDKLDDGGELSTEDETAAPSRPEKSNDGEPLGRPSLSSSSHDSPTKADSLGEERGGKRTVKKNSTMDRLKKAAKGKSSSKLGATAGPVAPAKEVTATREVTEEVDKTASAAKVDDEVVKSAVSPTKIVAKATSAAIAAAKETKAGKSTLKKSIAAQKKASGPARVIARKDIEYTDSSEDEEKQPAGQLKRAMASKPASRKVGTAGNGLSSASVSPNGKRTRHGVGGGAAFTAEPWLDVRSRKDWEKLAERFKRVYEEYVRDAGRLRDEEEMVRNDLEQAREEKRSSTKTARQAVAMSQNDASLPIDVDEKEEGEASPTLEQEGKFAGAMVGPHSPPSVGETVWRVGEKDDNASKNPLSLDEIQTRVQKLQETESQLSRMRGTLEMAKQTLQAA